MLSPLFALLLAHEGLILTDARWARPIEAHCVDLDPEFCGHLEPFVRERLAEVATRAPVARHLLNWDVADRRSGRHARLIFAHGARSRRRPEVLRLAAIGLAAGTYADENGTTTLVFMDRLVKRPDGEPDPQWRARLTAELAAQIYGPIQADLMAEAATPAPAPACADPLSPVGVDRPAGGG